MTGYIMFCTVVVNKKDNGESSFGRSRSPLQGIVFVCVCSVLYVCVCVCVSEIVRPEAPIHVDTGFVYMLVHFTFSLIDIFLLIMLCIISVEVCYHNT